MVVGRRNKLTANHLKIFAVVCHVLISHRIGPAIPALLCYVRIVADAIQANFQVRPARRAGLGASRSAGKLVLGAAFPAMSCQCHAERLEIFWGISKHEGERTASLWRRHSVYVPRKVSGGALRYTADSMRSPFSEPLRPGRGRGPGKPEHLVLFWNQAVFWCIFCQTVSSALDP